MACADQGSRRLRISVRVNVTIDCDAEVVNGDVRVTSVRSVDLPDPTEVMEAIDAEDAFGSLDEAYEKAGE